MKTTTSLRAVSVSVLLVTSISLGAGCSKDEKKPDEAPKIEAKKENTEKKTAVAKPKKTAEEKELQELADKIQTQEDFQEEVEKEITLDNVEAEADKLEQELAAAEE